MFDHLLMIFMHVHIVLCLLCHTETNTNKRFYCARIKTLLLLFFSLWFDTIILLCLFVSLYHVYTLSVKCFWYYCFILLYSLSSLILFAFCFVYVNCHEHHHEHVLVLSFWFDFVLFVRGYVSLSIFIVLLRQRLTYKIYWNNYCYVCLYHCNTDCCTILVIIQ